ncbi:aspartyl protease family protein [Hymenobacter busanensis]|nr:aspartyl protease family protein [Hymenobacter busanensis]QHJ05798.1 PDZ domain-containing protein [Hymenobacter busanensis]
MAPLALFRCLCANHAWQRLIWTVLVLLFTAEAGYAQALFQFKPAWRNSVRTSFQLERNLVVIQARLNGYGPYNFMLDTGVGTSIITDPTLRDSLGLRIGQQYLVAGVGEEAPVVAFQSDSVRVELAEGRIAAAALPMLLLSNDVFDLSAYVGMPIHGILGGDVFRHFVVEIEPESRQLIFRRPDKFKAPTGQKWAHLPIIIEGEKAYVETQARLSDSTEVPLKLVLDTGAGHALSLETGSDARIKLPDQRLRTHLGRGLSGDVHGYLGRVQSLRLGRYQLSALLTSFPDNASVRARVSVPRNGNLGFELLKRFHIIIDYPHNALLLRPNAQFRDPFEHDMCGLDLLATGTNFRNYVVHRVEAGSPAAQANLQPNDEILSINLMPVGNMTLSQISRMLHSADGRQLFLLVRRNGEMIATRLTLKRQI